MSNDTLNRDDILVDLNTIGHVDHGKTTLTAAIIYTLMSQSNIEDKEEVESMKEDPLNFLLPLSGE